MKREGEKWNLQCSHNIIHASMYVCVISAHESGHAGSILSNLVGVERRLSGNGLIVHMHACFHLPRAYIRICDIVEAHCGVRGNGSQLIKEQKMQQESSFNIEGLHQPRRRRPSRSKHPEFLPTSFLLI